MTERPIRLHVRPPLAGGAPLALTRAQAHYLGRVMRCRSGDRVRLFDGVTGEWSAVLDVRRQTTVATPLQQLLPQRPEPGPILAIPPIRRARLEWTMEKATELGIAALQPVLTERSGGERPNAARLHAIAVEAAEQSERLTVPSVSVPMSLADWLAERASSAPLYVALERSDAPNLLVAIGVHGPGDLLVGPEGGFAPAERATLLATRSGLPIGLGPRILRAETAAVAGLAVLALARARGGVQDG